MGEPIDLNRTYGHENKCKHYLSTDNFIGPVHACLLNVGTDKNKQLQCSEYCLSGDNCLCPHYEKEEQ